MKNNNLLKEITQYTGRTNLQNVLYYSSDRSISQYKLMRRYPMCWMGLQFIKLGLPDAAFTVVCSEKKYESIIKVQLKKIWHKLVREATECLDFGFKAFENRYEYGSLFYNEEESFSGILLRQPKGLDGESIEILVDADGSLKGFRQKVQGKNIDVLVAERKCLLFTHNLESGQYYGMSALETAYPFWYDAVLNRQFHMRWLERKGTGFFKGLYPAGKTDDVDNQDIMLSLLDNLIDGNVIALPSGRDDKGQLFWDVSYLSTDDKTDPFIERAKYIDEMILKALVIPEKALVQGEIGARASIEAFQNMFIQRKQAILNEIVDTINRYLLPHFIELNFGKNINVQIIASRLSDNAQEVAGLIVQKLLEKDKIEINKSWLVEKTGVPIIDNDSDISASSKTEKMSNIYDNEHVNKKEETSEWRELNSLEKKYNLVGIDNYIDKRQMQFLEAMKEELKLQIERIKRYIDKNYDINNYIKIVDEIEIKKSPIRRIIKDYLNDINEYVMKNFNEVLQVWMAENVNAYIGFRVDVVTNKLVTDLEAALKLQIGNDIAAAKSKLEVIDNISNITLETFVTSRMPVIAETEVGFILNRTVDDYIKTNHDAVKKGLIDEIKKIERVRYSAIMDNKVCAYCRKMDGIVVEAGSAVYYRFTPPIHYNCRCIWLPITAEEIADPRAEYTDLTLNNKGRPVTVDDVNGMIAGDSILKTFSCGVSL